MILKSRNYCIPEIIKICVACYINCMLSLNLSPVMRKTAVGIGENKGADQLHSMCTADKRFCFHYIDSMIPLLSKV